MNGAVSAPLIEVRDLTLRVGQRTLIRDFGMSVRPREMWCILGANGVGKTMFMHTLVGLRRPQSGAVHLAGKPLPQWSAVNAARFRGFLPQTNHDVFSAPVVQVVLMGRHPHLGRWQWEGQADRAAALAALKAVDLEKVADRDVTTLSGGERQRVAIAALLVQDAPLMLLDEPLAHLDLFHQIEVLQHLAFLARDQGRGVVLSLHDLNLAHRFATHGMLFGANTALLQGPIEDIMTEASLSGAFGCAVRKINMGARSIFVPD